MRATIFEDQHDQLRSSCARWVATGPAVADCLGSAAGAGLLGLTAPAEAGGQGADVLAAVVLAEEMGAVPAIAALVLEHGEVALPLLARATSDVAIGALLAGTASAVVAEGFTVSDGRVSGSCEVVGVEPLGGVLALVGADADAEVLWIDGSAHGLQIAPQDVIGGLPVLHLVADAVQASAVGGPDEAAWVRARRLLLTAANSAAGAEVAVARSRAHAGQREAFGKPVMAFQALRHAIVDAATGAAAAQSLVHAAATAMRDAEAGGGLADALRLAAAAALVGTSAHWRAIDLDVQVHGGMGYAMESDPAREWAVRRAARLLPVDESAMRRTVAGRGPLSWAGMLATPGLRDLRARARAFLDEHVMPRLPAWSHARKFPKDLFRTVGEEGWLGLKFDAPTPGEGLLRQAVWIEELARCGSGGLAADLGASSDLAAMYVHRAGDDDHRKRWLEPTVSGEMVGALAITEPDTGSDVAGITTRAQRDGDGWVIDGAKVFITNGSWADYLVVAAKVAPENGGGASPHGQITLFAVPGDAAGVTRGRLSMLGWNLSHTGELAFDGVRVSDDARLGDIGSGFGHIVANFAWERVSLAIGAVIAAESGLAWFGEDAPADLLARVAAGRAMTEQALRLTVRQADGHDDGAVTLRSVAMAKLATQSLAVEVLDAAIQHVGVPAMTAEHPLQRWWRDARLGPIGGGTDQIMREIIGKTW